MNVDEKVQNQLDSPWGISLQKDLLYIIGVNTLSLFYNHRLRLTKSS